MFIDLVSQFSQHWSTLIITVTNYQIINPFTIRKKISHYSPLDLTQLTYFLSSLHTDTVLESLVPQRITKFQDKNK